jgi:hypothetical protein
MRDLKRLHNYSLQEQESMFPFEREILLKTLEAEALAASDTPAQGWRAYAEEVGATKKTKYSEKYTVIDY